MPPYLDPKTLIRKGIGTLSGTFNPASPRTRLFPSSSNSTGILATLATAYPFLGAGDGNSVLAIGISAGI
jgi:hypothetical protein